jgi:arginine/lysine/ornithine decarboxylase
MAKAKTEDGTTEANVSEAKDFKYRCIAPCTYNGRYYSLGDIIVVRGEEVKHVCFEAVE